MNYAYYVHIVYRQTVFAFCVFRNDLRKILHKLKGVRTPKEINKKRKNKSRKIKHYPLPGYLLPVEDEGDKPKKTENKIKQEKG